jgi:uncharacterized protein (DUF1800 family)
MTVRRNSWDARGAQGRRHPGHPPEEKQTAHFLSAKFYRRFVNPEINEERVALLADEYYKSGYDTEAWMRTVLNALVFTRKKMSAQRSLPRGAAVRYNKLLSLEFPQEATLVNLQRALGRVLFFPPNVSGWKGGAPGLTARRC